VTKQFTIPFIDPQPTLNHHNIYQLNKADEYQQSMRRQVATGLNTLSQVGGDRNSEEILEEL
jgi:hypothetical protein